MFFCDKSGEVSVQAIQLFECFLSGQPLEFSMQQKCLFVFLISSFRILLKTCTQHENFIRLTILNVSTMEFLNEVRSLAPRVCGSEEYNSTMTPGIV